MEKVIDELEMISSPLAESEDSLISEMSNRNDITKSSWLEFRDVRRRRQERDGNESDFEEEDEVEDRWGAPPVPERDYSRRRPYVYRKHGEEFPMRRSKSQEKPTRPRTPERKWTRNARSLVDKTKKNHVYATPIRKKQPEPAIIEEFVEDVMPRYVRPLMEDVTAPEASSKPPVIDFSTEVEFSSKTCGEKRPAELKREDSLTSLLKRQLAARLEQKLPEYVEPKDPIVRELQEFLKIQPKHEESSSADTSATSFEKVERIEEEIEEKPAVLPIGEVKEKAVQADAHRLFVRGWQELLKSSSSSSTSSTNSTTV